MGKLKNILNVILALIMTGGFMVVFQKVFAESPLGVLVLMTLPLLVGSLLIGKEFDREGLWFLFSSIFLLVGFFGMLGASEGVSRWTMIIFINIGGFIFLITLLNLWEKVGNKLFENWIIKLKSLGKKK